MLLQGHLEGRELGTLLTALLLHITNTSLLWQQKAALESEEAADATALRNHRGQFVRVLESLLDVEDEGPGGLRELAFKLLTDLVMVAGSSKWEGTVLAGSRLMVQHQLIHK
jgi:hypothetical protein